jgi:hypothetical protein
LVVKSLQSGAALAAAATLSACGGGGGGSEADVPAAAERSAVAGAGGCLEQKGYVVDEDVDGTGFDVSSRDHRHRARVEARTTMVEGRAYLESIFDGLETSALRDAVFECVSPYDLG